MNDDYDNSPWDYGEPQTSNKAHLWIDYEDGLIDELKYAEVADEINNN